MVAFPAVPNAKDMFVREMVRPRPFWAAAATLVNDPTVYPPLRVSAPFPLKFAVSSPPDVPVVASLFTLTGAGFGVEPRHSFVDRCRAAAAAGFTGIGLHADDLPRTVAAGLDVAGMRGVLADTGLRVVEIEFLGGWALNAETQGLERTVERIEAVADAFGGRHVSAGEFRGDAPLDLDAAAARLDTLAERLDRRGMLVAVEAFPWSALAGPGTVTELTL